MRVQGVQRRVLLDHVAGDVEVVLVQLDSGTVSRLIRLYHKQLLVGLVLQLQKLRHLGLLHLEAVQVEMDLAGIEIPGNLERKVVRMQNEVPDLLNELQTVQLTLAHDLVFLHRQAVEHTFAAEVLQDHKLLVCRESRLAMLVSFKS